MTGLSRSSHLDNSNDAINVEKKQVVYAEFMHRLAAFFLDLVFFSLASVVIGLILNFIRDVFSLDSALNLIDEMRVNSSYLPLLQFLDMSIPAMVVGLFLSSKWQATPGKRLMGIYVTDNNLNRISFFKGFLRYFVKFTPYIVILFIAISVDFDFITQQSSENFNYEEYLASLPSGLMDSVFIFSIVFNILSFIWYLMAAYTKQRTAFHDLICKTRVLKGRQ